MKTPSMCLNILFVIIRINYLLLFINWYLLFCLRCLFLFVFVIVLIRVIICYLYVLGVITSIDFRFILYTIVRFIWILEKSANYRQSITYSCSFISEKFT